MSARDNICHFMIESKKLGTKQKKNIVDYVLTKETKNEKQKYKVKIFTAIDILLNSGMYQENRNEKRKANWKQ
jgi:hypothetical protein